MGGQLTGKVALVTGGASGIGLRTAQRFASEGAAVAVLDRDGTAAEQAAKQLAADGGRSVATPADGTDADSLAAAVERAEAELGPIDVLSANAGPNFGAYAASKAAANHLAKVLALELAPHQIRVNCLAPVATDTPMLPRFLGQDDPERARAAFVAGIPLGRLAEADDVADAAVFFASDASAFLTGVVLPVDGGRSL